MKTCSRCAEHPVARGHKNWCRPCLNAAGRDYNRRVGRRYLRYGLRPEDIAAMRLMQGDRCDICGSRLVAEHVDHNHTTGQVRALLCSSCNQGLGPFGDDPARLRAAAAYLERWV